MVASSLTNSTSPVSADDAARETEFRKTLQPLLRAYCIDCHDSGSEIPLGDDDSAMKIRDNRKAWIRALAQVRIGAMPPADGDPLNDESRKTMTRLIDELANAVDCVENPNAGKVAIRRLNRFEYRNTIRDLTGIDYTPAKNFPGDDVGYGFDNIGDVLSLPPLLIEKYLDAAEAITGKAIWTPPPPEIYETERAATSLIDSEKYAQNERLTMSSQGEVSLQLKIPFPGMYTLTVSASGDQGGDEPVKMEVQVGRKKIIVEIPEDEPTEHEIPLRLGPGTRTIQFRFINDYYVAGKIDRNLHLYHFKVHGLETRSQFASRPDLPPTHRKLIFATPSKSVNADQATMTVIGRFASRAFRRPVTDAETKKLAALAAKVRSEGGTYEEGIQVAMQAVMISPHFLFRVEQPQTITAAGEMPKITQYELATRISYFLWSSMPDDELLLLAHNGELRDRKKLLSKIGRMILDRRSNRFVENFAGQWLQLRNLDSIEPDTKIFRAYNEEIRDLMKRETLTFFANIMRQNMPVTKLLDADFTYLNEPLAKYYGLEGVNGDKFQKVSLAGTTRGGLLTHGSVLTVTSNPTRTSPVKRGKWVLDNLLNTPPPPPPPNIPELEKGQLTGTLRERLEQHRDNPACAACHNMMDPLGFALENFDAVGRWRTRDGNEEIDSSGILPDGTEFSGASELRDVLASKQKELFVRCLSEKMLIYALGRGTEYYDKCAIDQIVSEVQDRGNLFAYLILAIIESDPFQKQGFRE